MLYAPHDLYLIRSARTLASHWARQNRAESTGLPSSEPMSASWRVREISGKPACKKAKAIGRAGDLEGTELWPLRAVHGSAGSAGELYIAVPAGRTA